MVNDNTEIDTEEIHSTGYVKLGRRGLTKKLAALGFSTTAAASLTSEDVRAAASDEVPIVVGYKRTDPEDPFSERVRHVEYVPSVWYDGLQRARRAKDVAERRYLSNPGIVGVGVAPGKGTAKSSVLVFTDRDPAKVAGPGREMTLSDAAESVPVEYERVEGIEAACDVSELDWWDATSEPGYGGYYIYVPDPGVSGTLATEIYDYSGRYGLSAYHVLKNEGNVVEDSYGNTIGTANSEQHCEEDWGLFDVPSGIDLRNEVRFNGHDGVTGSYTKDGTSTLVQQDEYCEKVGHTTCQTWMEVEGVDITLEVDGQCWQATHQTYYEASDGDFEGGDSGSLVYNESPDDPDYCWAVSLANYHGTSYYNDHDVWGIGAWRIEDRGYYF